MDHPNIWLQKSLRKVGAFTMFNAATGVRFAYVEQDPQRCLRLRCYCTLSKNIIYDFRSSNKVGFSLVRRNLKKTEDFHFHRSINLANALSKFTSISMFSDPVTFKRDLRKHCLSRLKNNFTL